MPSVNSSTNFVQGAPSAFQSVLSDKPPISFYSSITIPRARDDSACAKCALFATEDNGLTRETMNEFIAELVKTPAETGFRSPIFDGGGAEISENVPPTPPLA